MGNAGTTGPQMPPAGLIEAPRAYWLAQGMARASGVALARAVGQGALTRRDLSVMVGRCQTCTFASACHIWLAEPRQVEPPAFCAIGPDILALARKTKPASAL